MAIAQLSAGVRKWLMLVAMGSVGGLILLDETVIGIALPSIRHDLGMSQVDSHWVVSVYLLTFAGFAAVGGKLGDLFGLGRVFVLSVILFALASLAAGFSSEGVWLISARSVQGLGAAVIFPLSAAMVTTVFPREQHGLALGTVASIGTAFLAAGPLVGGLFTELLSWRWIFWINVPVVVLIVLLVTAVWDEPPRKDQQVSIDFGGLVTLVGGLGLLVFATMEVGRSGPTNPAILFALGFGLILLCAFVVIENRQARPLIAVGLFRKANFTAATLLIGVSQFSKIVVLVYGALYLQDVLHMKPLTAGWALLVAVALTPFAAPLAGRAADKYGTRRPGLLGLTISALAVLWIGATADAKSYALVAPGLLVWGAALPLCHLPPLRSIMGAVPPQQQGQASGISMTVRLVGGALGMAVGSSLLTITGSFQTLFLGTAVVLILALVISWWAMESPSN